MSVPRIELPQRLRQKVWTRVVGKTPRDQGPIWVPMSLQAQKTDVYLPNICISISLWSALLPFEVLNHTQQPLLPLAVQGEGLAPFSWLAEFSWVSSMNTYYWNFVWLSLVNLSHVHFILRPARRTWQGKQEFLAPLQLQLGVWAMVVRGKRSLFWWRAWEGRRGGRGRGGL